MNSQAIPVCEENPITHPAAISTQATSVVQPRAIGSVELRVKPIEDRTEIRDLRQAGSLKCLFPRQCDLTRDAVLVNTAGGITGGDSMRFSGHAEPGTALTVTTQAAERAYRATGPEMGCVENRLTLDAGARVNWVPQETILFDGSALSRSTQIDLQRDASLLFCEPLAFGRLAMDEVLRNVHFHDRVVIFRDGIPLYQDAVRMAGNIHAHLDRPFVANGARAMANLVYVAPNASVHLDPIRLLLPETGGTSLLADDVLVLRLLAADSYDLRKSLIPVLKRLLRSDLPRCWMI